jgi:hypothetical protein
MYRETVAAASCLMFLTGLVATTATFAQDIRQLVPESALGLVVINCTIDADAKLQELGRQLRFPIPSLLAKLEQEGFRAGLDEQGTAALILLPPAGTPWPTPILLTPVTDYGKFIAQFKPETPVDGVTKIEVKSTPMYARSLGKYAAITDASHRVPLAKTLSLSAKVSEALAPWDTTLKENDVTAIILQPGVKLISAQAQMGIRLMKPALAQAGDQGKQVAAIFDSYEKMFQAVEKEMSAVGFGIRLDKQGVLHATKRGRFVPGGSWARSVSQFQPPKEDLLAGLPSGPFVMAGGGAVPEGIWDSFLAFSVEMMESMHEVYGLSKEQASQMPMTSLAAMKQVRTISMVMGAGPSNASLYSKLVAVMRVDDAAAFMADYERAFKDYGEFTRKVNSPMLPPLEVAKSQFDGSPALQFTTKIPQIPAAQQTPQQSKIMAEFLGPSGELTGWVAVADQHTVVAGYVNQDAMRTAVQMIKQGKGELGGDVDVAKTAALLPAGAFGVAFWSPQGTVQLVNRLLPAFVPGGPSAFKLPEFDKTPPIGFAITSGPNELTGHMVVPVEVLNAIGQYVGKVKP